MAQTFKDFAYIRPDYAEYKASVETELAMLKNAATPEDAKVAIDAINKLRNTLETMATLSSIRHSINTKDTFYADEKNYWDEHGPLFAEIDNDFFKVILASPHLEALKSLLPHTFFDIMEFNAKVFSKEIIEDMQEENRLATEYDKLIASAAIEFDGEKRTLPQLTPYIQSPDRSVRKAASDAKYAFFKEHDEAIGNIYDKLVKVRHKMAVKLGFKNYIEMGYYSMLRFDYNADDVATYRNEIKTHIVPLTETLYKQQAQRIGVDTLTYYDKTFEFVDGNATPKGTLSEIVGYASEMYHEMSPETDDFFQLMVEKDLLDLDSKDGKQGGGYCTFIPDFDAPFIFANFNGTAGDVDVLTHEVGHAFQVYQSRHIGIPDIIFPTNESCEIHSMSMEFFAWPYMDKFFKDEADKYRYQHLNRGAKFLPYGALVDHFQHEVYERPEMTPAERNATWRKLEKMYLPSISCDENEYLDSGIYWYQQGHIFSVPFYYIDYTLAQVCAFQFWKRAMVDHDTKAWEDYLKICQVGGAASFLEIVQLANLSSPFNEGSLATIATAIEEWLEKNEI